LIVTASTRAISASSMVRLALHSSPIGLSRQAALPPSEGPPSTENVCPLT
jgi:hypothetical protein